MYTSPRLLALVTLLTVVNAVAIKNEARQLPEDFFGDTLEPTTTISTATATTTPAQPPLKTIIAGEGIPAVRRQDAAAVKNEARQLPEDFFGDPNAPNDTSLPETGTDDTLQPIPTIIAEGNTLPSRRQESPTSYIATSVEIRSAKGVQTVNLDFTHPVNGSDVTGSCSLTIPESEVKWIHESRCDSESDVVFTFKIFQGAPLRGPLAPLSLAIVGSDEPDRSHGLGISNLFTDQYFDGCGGATEPPFTCALAEGAAPDF